MALRAGLWSVALPILLALPAVQAEQVAGCIQDDPALTRQAGVAEPAIRPVAAADSLDVARTLNDAGDAALERGDLVNAQAYHRRALAIRQKLAPRSLLVAESVNALGNVALDRGDYAVAKAYLERSLRIRQALAPGSRELALSLMSLGNFARRRGERVGVDADGKSGHARALAKGLKGAVGADRAAGLIDDVSAKGTHVGCGL